MVVEFILYDSFAQFWQGWFSSTHIILMVFLSSEYITLQLTLHAKLQLYSKKKIRFQLSI